ncbi:MAG TPA: hypothetical protein VL860_09950, partial [Planctomycetota bacterium]|nr:hypothetical protein [Planctomycetota bacterium]
LARNAAGDTLFVWTEGTGWQKGGKLAWQLYDKSDKPIAGEAATGNKDGVVTWGLVSAAARSDGSFVVVY